MFFVRSIETVIDSSDRAIVAGIWVIRNIGRVLAYDFLLLPDRFCLQANLGSTFHIIQFWDICFQ